MKKTFITSLLKLLFINSLYFFFIVKISIAIHQKISNISSRRTFHQYTFIDSITLDILFLVIDRHRIQGSRLSFFAPFNCVHV